MLEISDCSTLIQISYSMLGDHDVAFNVLEAETKLITLVMLSVGPPSHRLGATHYLPLLFPG